MRTRHLFVASILSAGLLLPHVGAASTVYVDSKLADYTGHDGSSWALAFKTIQEGVEACGTSGTVYVAKGEYNQGGAYAAGESSGFTNRVCITAKGVTVEGVDGASETFIVGARASAEKAVDVLGNGPDAVRCLFVSADDVVVKGFTLVGGAAHATAARENARSADGGGFRSTNSGYTSCIVDCVVSNCVGVRSGAVQYGRAVRCLIAGNNAIVKGSGGNNSKFQHCVFTRNGEGSDGAICIAGIAVNCTFYRNPASAIGSEATKLLNCVETCNTLVGTTSAGSQISASNCVFQTGTKNGISFFTTIGATVTNASPYQLCNPMFDDFRLLPGSEAIGAGSAEYLTLCTFPSRVDASKDFAGTTVLAANGAVDAGAIQGAAAAPEGGALYFPDKAISVDGVKAQVGGEYVFAETYPTQFFVTATPPSGNYLFSFRRTGKGYTGSSGEFLATMPDDTIWMMPPTAGLAYTNALITVNRCYYVDPNKGNDGNAGTTTNAPFKTIQAAVDASGTSRSIIYCAEGIYDSDDGLKVVAGMTNRVSISDGQTFRIIGAGVGKSIIKGAGDESDPAGDGTKRGPAAIRCYATVSGSANIIQGFTLTDGRCGYTGDGTGNVLQHSGGGAYVGGTISPNYIVADCMVTNCIGYRGAVYGGTALRCRFVDSCGFNGGLRYCRAVSSLFYANPFNAGSKRMLSSNCLFVHCTAIGMDRTSDKLIAGGGIGITNSIIYTIYGTSSNYDLYGTYVGDSGDKINKGIPADPQFFDAASRDYSLLATSPCVGGGVLSDDYARNYSPGLDGEPIMFVDGLPTAGACQNLKAAYVVLGDGRNGVSLSPSGTNALAAGESVTITFNGSGATRPISGFLVNGEMEDYSENASWTYTAPAAGERVTSGFFVEPVFSTNWYVNAESDVADGNGVSPSTPKKAFHGPGGVFDECNVQSGDCIHVAEGTYASGEGVCNVSGSVSAYVNARCSVPANVMVVADGAADRTFIVGRDGNTGPIDAKGRGTNSVRCVYLRDKSSVVGFTLTGGRTCGDGVSNPDNYGGGVYAINNNATIIDCVISNNASSRGGGMHNGKAIRCRFFDNWALKNRAAVSQGMMYGCVVDRNRGEKATQNTLGIWNCTFGPNNTKEDGATATLSLGMPYGPVVNSVMCQGVQVDSSKYAYFTNCIFVAVTDAKHLGVYSSCITTNASVLTFNADYAPVIGTNPAVDAGSAEFTPSMLLADNDVNGSQRIYNGVIDIGAAEADWRGVYAAALGRLVSVTSATENVTIADGKVRLGDGDSIAGTWSPSAPDVKIDYSAVAEHAGDGALAGAFTDGAGNVLASAEVTSGAASMAFCGKNLTVGFEFGSAGGSGLLSSFAQKARATIFVLR